MNIKTRIGKQSHWSPPGRPDLCGRTRALRAAREARAPPMAEATTTNTVPQWHEVIILRSCSYCY